MACGPQQPSTECFAGISQGPSGSPEWLISGTPLQLGELLGREAGPPSHSDTRSLLTALLGPENTWAENTWAALGRGAGRTSTPGGGNCRYAMWGFSVALGRVGGGWGSG